MKPAIIEGQRVPEVTFRVREGATWLDVTTADLFADKTVVVFSLPGAFTPTCSSAHVPRYEELYDALQDAGVDDVLCMSVNDTFVMNAWKEDQGADRVVFVPDGNGEFTKAMGLLVDKAQIGFGPRSWRYSMLVKDGVIEKMFIEPEVGGDPYGVSDADTMLKYLGGTAPADITLFTKPGCSHCERAIAALEEAGLEWDELPTSPRILRSLPGAGTTPQVFIDGKHVGGADELIAWLAKR